MINLRQDAASSSVCCRGRLFEAVPPSFFQKLHSNFELFCSVRDGFTACSEPAQSLPLELKLLSSLALQTTTYTSEDVLFGEVEEKQFFLWHFPYFQLVWFFFYCLYTVTWTRHPQAVLPRRRPLTDTSALFSAFTSTRTSTSFSVDAWAQISFKRYFSAVTTHIFPQYSLVLHHEDSNILFHSLHTILCGLSLFEHYYKITQGQV